MHFPTLFAISALVFAGVSYATDDRLYILQEPAGDDGLYHWRMLYGTHDPRSGVWHDVVWSDSCEVGMEHRSKAWNEAKSGGVLGTFDLGHLKSHSKEKLAQVAKSTPTPQYKIEDLHKNCQTWVEDVVHKLVDVKELEKKALDVMKTVPKQGPVSGSSSPKSRKSPSPPKRRSLARRTRLARALTEAIRLAVREAEMDALAARMEGPNYWN
ncbi:hypothetical protein H0H87_007774 [Tephrocybe sp. NHM501043]|nr:hypothetical protein H0H87_007774 [Tephrocybe sp. NHM501043]